MKPLSHYDCEIYCCKHVPISLYSTCTTNKCINHTPNYTKQLVISLYHKQVHQPCTNMYLNLYHQQVHQPCTNLYLNLYHQQMHQPCTKYVPILHQVHINYDSSRCTNIVNYTPHVCANSSTTCLNHVPNMYLNQNPSSISSSKSDL
jgi:hypothetical protein